jgi:hypothetical protein
MEIHVCSKWKKNRNDTEETNAEKLKRYDAARAKINRELKRI